MSSPAALTADPLAPFRLDGQVAVVTGASSGLGDRFARVLHAAGATVVRGRPPQGAPRRARRASCPARLGGRRATWPSPTTASAWWPRPSSGAGRSTSSSTTPASATWWPSRTRTSTTFRQAMERQRHAPSGTCRKLVGAPMVRRAAGQHRQRRSMLGLVGSAPIKQAHYCASQGRGRQPHPGAGAAVGPQGRAGERACAPAGSRSEMTARDGDDEGASASSTPTRPIPRMGEAPRARRAAAAAGQPTPARYMTGHTLAVDGGWVAR